MATAVAARAHRDFGNDHVTFFTALPSAFMTKNAHLGVDGHRWKAIRRPSGDQDSRASSSFERVTLV
jgi:hypothetical protein